MLSSAGLSSTGETRRTQFGKELQSLSVWSTEKRPRDLGLEPEEEKTQGSLVSVKV